MIAKDTSASGFGAVGELGERLIQRRIQSRRTATFSLTCCCRAMAASRVVKISSARSISPAPNTGSRIVHPALGVHVGRGRGQKSLDLTQHGLEVLVDARPDVLGGGEPRPQLERGGGELLPGQLDVAAVEGDDAEAQVSHRLRSWCPCSVPPPWRLHPRCRPRRPGRVLRRPARRSSERPSRSAAMSGSASAVPSPRTGFHISTGAATPVADPLIPRARLTRSARDVLSRKTARHAQHRSPQGPSRGGVRRHSLLPDGLRSCRHRRPRPPRQAAVGPATSMDRPTTCPGFARQRVCTHPRTSSAADLLSELESPRTKGRTVVARGRVSP